MISHQLSHWDIYLTRAKEKPPEFGRLSAAALFPPLPSVTSPSTIYRARHTRHHHAITRRIDGLVRLELSKNTTRTIPAPGHYRSLAAISIPPSEDQLHRRWCVYQRKPSNQCEASCADPIVGRSRSCDRGPDNDNGDDDDSNKDDDALSLSPSAIVMSAFLARSMDGGART